MPEVTEFSSFLPCCFHVFFCINSVSISRIISILVVGALKIVVQSSGLLFPIAIVVDAVESLICLQTRTLETCSKISSRRSYCEHTYGSKHRSEWAVQFLYVLAIDRNSEILPYST